MSTNFCNYCHQKTFKFIVKKNSKIMIMSDAISKRIKQLENQNDKFKKLLDSTLQITSEDAAKYVQLENEAVLLKKALAELENQKVQLESELSYFVRKPPGPPISDRSIEIQEKLSNAINDIERKSLEIQDMQTDDENLQALVTELEREKNQLIKEISLVKKANEDNVNLIQENMRLKQELLKLQKQLPQQSVNSSSSNQELIKKLASIENLMEKLQNDIDTAKLTNCSDPLGSPTENIVLELKFAALEKQREVALKALKASLLESADEVCKMYSSTSDGHLRGLINEIEIQKTILMMNLDEYKQIHRARTIKQQKCLLDYQRLNNLDIPIIDERESNPFIEIRESLLTSLNHEIDVKQFLLTNNSEHPVEKNNSNSSFPCNSSEIIEKVTDIKEEKGSEENLSQCDDYELPTVSEEDEGANVLANEEPEQLLRKAVEQLENAETNLVAPNVETNDLQDVIGIEFQEEIQGAVMRETSSKEIRKLPLDDATNQLFVNEEQLLAQRIRELEEDNHRIVRDLNGMLTDTNDDVILQEGERLIRDHRGNVLEKDD